MLSETENNRVEHASRAERFGPVDFTTRIPALDGLRALAILLVFVSHYGGGLHGNFVMRIIGHVRERGWIGVDLFFVLSGFLITGILYDTRNDPGYFRKFYARRALRIFPVFYATAVLLLLLTPLLRWHWRPMQALFLVYLGNIPATRDFSLYLVDSGRSKVLTLFLAHLWSLCVEEQFYLLWPLLVWMARTRQRILWLALVVMVAELGVRTWIVQHTTFGDAQNLMFRNLPFRADTLMAGAMLAMVVRGPWAAAWQRASKWIFLGTLAVLLCLAGASSDPAAKWQLSLGLSLVAVMCMGLVGAVLAPQSAWTTVFSARPLRVLGRYSYGFYLFHVLLLNFWYWLMGAAGFVVHSAVLGSAIAVGTNFALTFLLAKLSYQRLERPFLRRKRDWSYQSEIAEARPLTDRGAC